MKEKKTRRQKIVSLCYLIACFIVTEIIAILIYTLVLRQLIENKTAKALFNVGWLYLCLYIYYRLTKCYTSWWSSLEEEKTNN